LLEPNPVNAGANYIIRIGLEEIFHLFDFNNNTILDSLGQEISFTDADYTSAYTGAQINAFIGGVAI
jgi:hypothetical protein